MGNSYIDMMIESLNKKKTLLKLLIDKTEEQKNLFKDNEGEADWDSFDVIINEKDEFINDIIELDKGFENLFARVKEELDGNKDLYKSQIATMQGLISEVTDLSTKLEALEKRNKNLIESELNKGKQNIRNSKVSSKVAMDYYNRMNKINVVDPQLMDKKS